MIIQKIINSSATIWKEVSNKIDGKLIVNSLSKNKTPIFACFSVFVIAYLAKRELDKRNISYKEAPLLLVTKVAILGKKLILTPALSKRKDSLHRI